MVSDQEIASCVESLLRSSSSSSSVSGTSDAGASLTAVLQQAETKLGVDLSHKASFIRDQIDLFFGPRLQPPSKPSPPSSSPAPPPAAAAVQPPIPHPPPSLSIPTAATLQPHVIFQAMPQLPAAAAVTTAAAGSAASAAAAPPAVPAMAFYPPPPLAFRYANAIPLAAGPGAAVSFQQQLQQPPLGGATVVAGGAQGGDPKDSANAAKRKRGGPGGLNKVCAISPELQTIVGETVMSRTQIVKQLWAYIRKNNLQDPDDKRKIICNDELRVVFGTDTTDMFKMNKLLAKHITPIDPKDQIREVKKLRPANVVAHPKPNTSQSSVVISDALAKFIGTEGTVPQDDALKYLWDYIKANQLEDVMNSSILCDSKLQELFGCESIPISGLSELLAHHFIKKT